MSSKGKRKNYRQNFDQTAYNKKPRTANLQAGDCGFLVFCAVGTEFKAIRESYDLLNQYVQPEGKVIGDPQDDGDRVASDDSDVEKALKNACESLKSEKHFFKAVETGAKCCCFIKSDLLNEKPTSLALRILSDLQVQGQSKSRFIQRLVPVDFTFRAACDKDFTDACSNFIEKFVKNESDQFRTFAIVFRSRNNTSITKEMAYDCLWNAMISVNPTSKVDLEKPDRVILVEIFSRVGCMALLRDYYPLSRYNLHEIVKKATAGPSEECAGKNGKLKLD